MQYVEMIIIILIFRQNRNLNHGELAKWYMLNSKQILILEAATVGISNQMLDMWCTKVSCPIHQPQTNKMIFVFVHCIHV